MSERIIVADDHPLTRDALASLLGRNGFDVVGGAAHGAGGGEGGPTRAPPPRPPPAAPLSGGRGGRGATPPGASGGGGTPRQRAFWPRFSEKPSSAASTS